MLRFPLSIADCLFLGPLEDAISVKFLPALTGRSFSDIEISFFSLPTRLDGLGIGDPRLLSDSQFDSSMKITTALVAQIAQQDSLFSMATVEAQRLAKSDVVRVNHQVQADLAASLHRYLPLDLQRILSLSSEKGVAFSSAGE